MKTKFSILIASVVLFMSTANAQNENDALRYSMLNYGSTARSLGMSNSFGALGADFSTLAINPAGIGLYRHSEITLTPLFSNQTVTNDFLGKSTTANYFKFAFGNLGVVFAGENTKAGSHFKSWAFGVGYNRTNNFSSRNIAEGNNGANSLLDNYLQQLDGTYPEDIPQDFPFDVDLAWQTLLIDTTTINGDLYYFNNATPFAGELQRRSITTKGGQGEWDFSLGTNIDDKLFLGFTFGLATVNYEENNVWEEKDNMDTIPFFNSFSYFQNLKTSGNGINFKLGAIYKVSDALRLGAAVHSPTYYRLTDNYNSNIRTDLQNGEIYTYNGPEYLPFSYFLTTPFRAIGSVGIIAAGSIAINADYEFVNYKHARMHADDNIYNNYFDNVNDNVRSEFTTSHNIRLGAEYRLDNLRFRVGGQYATSPLKNPAFNSNDLSSYGLSAGFGIKEEHFFVDFGYAYTEMNSSSIPYAYENAPEIMSKQQEHRLLITLGVNF